MMLHVVVAALIVAAGPSASGLEVCKPPYVPPPTKDRDGKTISFDYEVATSHPDAAPGDVSKQAVEALVAKHCRVPDPAACAPLYSKIKPWSFGKSTAVSCAMAVIHPQDADDFRSQLAPDFAPKLLDTLRHLFPPTPPPKGKLVAPKKTVRVQIDRIDDAGNAGGERAEWLLSQVEATLTKLDIIMVEPEKGFRGLFPNKVDYVLHGTVTDRINERQVPVIDVSFKLTDKKKEVRRAPSFVAPTTVAPRPPVKLPPVPPETELRLHVEKRGAGSLCHGDHTMIYVTNQAKVPLYVRVINLDANGEAIVIFPNEMESNDLVGAEKTIAIAPDGFTVEGPQNGRERYVVIGAPTREGLGRFRQTRGFCRYSPADAKALSSGAIIDAPYRAQDGFTFLSDVLCKKPLPLPDPHLIAQALADIPFCPALER